MKYTQIYLALSDPGQLTMFSAVCKSLKITWKTLKKDEPLTKPSEGDINLLIVDPNSTKQLSQLSKSLKSAKTLLCLMVVPREQTADGWLQQGVDDVIRWPLSPDELKARILSFHKIAQLQERGSNIFEEDIDLLVKSSATSIWLIDRNYHFIKLNKSFKEFCRLSYDIQLESGMSALDFLPERLKKLWKAKYDQVLKAGEKVVFGYSEKVKDNVHYFEVHLTPVIEGGKAERVFVNQNDISESKRYLRKLEETNAMLRKAEAVGKMGFLFLDLETNEIQLSDEVYEIYGLDKNETYLNSDFIAKVVHPDDMAYVKENLDLAIKNIKKYDIKHRIVRPDGQVIWTHSKAELVFDEKGKAKTLLGTTLDISELKRAEEEIRNKNRQLTNIIENAGDAMFILDFETEKVLMANRQACLSLGYTKEELLALKISDINPLFVSLKNRKKIWDNFVPDQTTIFEAIHKRKDGTLFPVEIRSGSFNYGGKKAILGFARDITQRKKSQQELEENEDNLRTILHSIGDAVITTDRSGKIKLMNTLAEALTGWSESDAMNKLFKDVVHIIDENTRKRIADPIEKVIKKGGVLYFGKNALLVSKSGNEIPVSDSGAPILNSEGQITGIVFVFRDQTQERKHRRELRESEEKYRMAFKTSPDSININRLDGLYVDINDSFTALTGYSRQDVIGKLSSEINIWAIPEDREKLIKDLDEKGYAENLESVFRSKDGSLKTGLMSARVIMLNSEPHILSITRDISERKKSEEAIRLRDHALNSADNAIVITNSDGTIEWVNKAFTTLTGYSFHEATGQNPRLLKSGKHDRQFYEMLWNTILAGKVWKGEFVNKRKDGTLYTEEQIITPVLDENNKISRFIGIKTDITQRKETELELEIYQNRLEDLVRERTRELEQKNKELERFNKLFIGKEFRLNEMREEISKLKRRLKEKI